MTEPTMYVGVFSEVRRKPCALTGSILRLMRRNYVGMVRIEWPRAAFFLPNIREASLGGLPLTKPGCCWKSSVSWPVLWLTRDKVVRIPYGKGLLGTSITAIQSGVNPEKRKLALLVGRDGREHPIEVNSCPIYNKFKTSNVCLPQEEARIQ